MKKKLLMILLVVSLFIFKSEVSARCIETNVKDKNVKQGYDLELKYKRASGEMTLTQGGYEADNEKLMITVSSSSNCPNWLHITYFDNDVNYIYSHKQGVIDEEAPIYDLYKLNNQNVGSEILTCTYKFSARHDVTYTDNCESQEKKTIPIKPSDNNGVVDICSTGLPNYIKKAFNLIRYIVPIIIVVMSAVDFVGVVASGENDKMEKAKKKFITRLIVGALIILVPVFVELILRLAGIISGDLSDVTCQIFEK